MLESSALGLVILVALYQNYENWLYAYVLTLPDDAKKEYLRTNNKSTTTV